MSISGRDIAALWQAVREKRPLVHNITNWVVTNITANALLAIGASPVMAHALEEVAEMTLLAQALVLNIGTLTAPVVEAMVRAGQAARQKGIPVVLDPVGAGATAMRTESARRILREVPVTILRGNASEIAVTGGYEAKTIGVDAGESPAEPAEIARSVARKLGLTVAVTGPVDYVSDGRRLVAVKNGHPMLTHVTGTGCMATAITGALAAVCPQDPLLAAAAALAGYGLAAEKAAAKTKGPGSFAVNLFDALFGLTAEEIADGARVEVLS